MTQRFFLLLLSFFSSSVFAQTDPWQFILDAHQACRNLNYHGVLQAEHLQEIRSLEIIHAKHGEQEYTRINTLDGTPSELLSQGDATFVYGTKQDNVVIQKRNQHRLFPAVLPKSTSNLKKVYQIDMGKVDRVAGRPANVIILMPNDEYRYFYHFWLDKETSIPLKMIVSDHSNQLIEQTSFTKVNVNSEDDLSWFKPDIDLSKEYVMHEEEDFSANTPRFWKMATIPEGFKEISFRVTRISGPNVLNHHLIYSDGLASLSLFIQPVPKGQKPKQGSAKVGNTNISAKYMKGYQVMAVGSVPQKTVESFVNSVSF